MNRYLEFILSFLIIVIIIALVSWCMIEVFNNQLELNKNVEKTCKEVNGYYELTNQGTSVCYDYDEDGYKFYWARDENGRLYKLRS